MSKKKSQDQKNRGDGSDGYGEGRGDDYVPFFLAQSSYNADSEDEEWLSSRRNINIDDFEHIIEKLEISSQNDIIRPSRRNSSNLDFIKDDKTIQRNIELWNSATLITSTTLSLPTTSGDDSSELEKIAATDSNSIIDGRYQFKRKHGCRYNAPTPRNLLNERQQHLSMLNDELSTFRCFSARKSAMNQLMKFPRKG
uniref:Uncharacterized protein n=1 Tax=Meloidogyne javanica TaxID=6303 RepID=A0A915LUW9_MELJA